MDSGVYDDVTCNQAEEDVKEIKIELSEYDFQEQVVDSIVRTEKGSDSNSKNEDVYPRKRPRVAEKQTQPHNSKGDVKPEVKTKADKKASSEKIFNSQITCKCENNKTQNKKTKPICPRKISLDRQKEIFYAYNQNRSWTQKTMFIRSSVKRVRVKSKKSHSCPLASKGKEYHHIYTLKDENGMEQEVCRDFFLKCLQITPVRVFGALKTSLSNPNAVENRGHGPPHNKTPLASKQSVQKFIDSIPKYESHYGNSFSESKYLHHSLNLKTIYEEYKRLCDLEKEPLVSERVFRKIFNTEYDLLFKRQQSDSCRICKETKSVADLGHEKNQLREKHCNLLKATCEAFADDVKRATESNGKKLVLTFDLQKTLDTPSLSAPETFYKRPLWTYNFCVYNEVEKKAWMYVWSENIASRGGQEIGSCLLKHLKRYTSNDVTEIILYSDPCGGQNRNIKLTMILKKFLHDFYKDNDLSTIQQKYFVPGHSFNNCSRCFAKIESEFKKSKTDIYTPSDWVKFIQNVKLTEKIEVTVMQEEDFVSSANLISLIRKSQIPWLKFDTITYCKNEPYTLYPVSENKSILRVDFKRNTSTNESLTVCKFSTLYPGGRPISKPKYNDLIELLKYIPPELHEFYKGLKYDDEEDYGLASDVSDE